MSDKTISNQNVPVAIVAAQASPRTKHSIYPEPFASRMAGREKRPLGDRSAGDSAVYPDDDLQGALVDGKWKFSHKDGTPY